MSKKPLVAADVRRLSTNYLQALADTKSEIEVLNTEVSFRKGHFYIRPAGCSAEYVPIPLRPKELEQETLRLQQEAS